jgi:hypothetical protein
VEERRARRILWSMVSKAAERSRRMRADIFSGSLQVRGHFECGEELFRLSGIHIDRLKGTNGRKGL